MIRCRRAVDERSSLVNYSSYRLGEAPRSSTSILDAACHGPALWRLIKRGLLHHGDPDEVIVPELYLQGAGECFTLTAVVTWLITATFNPAVIRRNLLKDVVGYNNVCVGFDEPPARYVAVPCFAMVTALGFRYVSLDSLRAQLQVIDVEEGYKIMFWQYAFTRCANALYGGFVCCLSLLLVITPDVHRGVHSAGYIAIIAFSWLVIVANYAEAKEVAIPSRAWMLTFSLLSIAIVFLGIIDFVNYDFGACERAACNRRRRSDPSSYVTCPVVAILSDAARSACEQPPAVPAWLLGACDYGWFLTLSLTTVFLPKAPPIHADYELRPIHPQHPVHAPTEAVAAADLAAAHCATIADRPPLGRMQTAPTYCSCSQPPARRFLSSPKVAVTPATFAPLRTPS